MTNEENKNNFENAEDSAGAESVSDGNNKSVDGASRFPFFLFFALTLATFIFVAMSVSQSAFYDLDIRRTNNLCHQKEDELKRLSRVVESQESDLAKRNEALEAERIRLIEIANSNRVEFAKAEKEEENRRKQLMDERNRYMAETVSNRLVLAQAVEDLIPAKKELEMVLANISMKKAEIIKADEVLSKINETSASVKGDVKVQETILQKLKNEVATLLSDIEKARSEKDAILVQIVKEKGALEEVKSKYSVEDAKYKDSIQRIEALQVQHKELMDNIENIKREELTRKISTDAKIKAMDDKLSTAEELLSEKSSKLQMLKLEEIKVNEMCEALKRQIDELRKQELELQGKVSALDAELKLKENKDQAEENKKEVE